jgi:hypothetical protein
MGAAALAPALYAMTALTSLRLMSGNLCCWQSLADSDLVSRPKLCPLLDSLWAAECRMELGSVM